MMESEEMKSERISRRKNVSVAWKKTEGISENDDGVVQKIDEGKGKKEVEKTIAKGLVNRDHNEVKEVSIEDSEDSVRSSDDKGRVVYEMNRLESD